MDSRYIVSFVVCLNEDIDMNRKEYGLINLAKTYSSIQLVVVYDKVSEPVKEQIFDETYNDNISFVYASEQGLDDRLKANIKGDFVSFSRLEVSVTEKDVMKLTDCGNKNDADIVIARISLDEKLGRIIREHDNYCDRFEKGTSLDTNVYMLHNISFGYFFKTDKVEIPKDITASKWAFDIIRLTYANAITLQNMVYAKGVDIHYTVNRPAISAWDDLFAGETGQKNIFNNLIRRLDEIRRRDDIIYRTNADYALLYYVSRLSGCVTGLADKNETLADEIIDFIDAFMESISSTEIIMANKYISRANKNYILKNYFDIYESNGTQELDAIFEPSHFKAGMIYFLEKDGIIRMEYTVEQPSDVSFDVCLLVDGEEAAVTETADYTEVYWAGRISARRKLYIYDIKADEIRKSIALCIKTDKGVVNLTETIYGRYTPFTIKADLFIKLCDRLLYVGDDQNTIAVIPYTNKNEAALIHKRNKSFIKRGVPGAKAIAARRLFQQRSEKEDKKIWLFSDRTNRGDDNGEVLFTYVCENPIDGVEPYFVIDKETDDWSRMQEYGKVVAPFSREHKMLFLMSEYSLSSQANAAVINPFGKYEYLYRDLMYNKRLVFLQHGITKDNQSKWLNKYNRNLYGFIVTTKPEYDSVFEYDYFYKPDRVWLTGMPRYDKLYHDERKYITVMPTWRKSLSAGTDEKGVWILGDEFKSSEYFKFYNNLLNSEKLIEAADKYGYKICFMPHPNTIAGINMFNHNPKVEFMDMSFSYRDVFAQTDLMITDYSSVAFDFAYLRKPIIYSQFDKESFFSGEHSYTEGYFDYERDGFGEVEYTLDAVIDRIIEYMQSGCRLKREYEERINDTFAFNDKDCCKRVIEYIEKYK